MNDLEQQSSSFAAPQSGAPILEIQKLGKQFVRQTGEVVKALQEVSFRVERGTLAGLVGPDGAGKTTLLRLLTGLLMPDQGEIKILGMQTELDPQAVQNQIGYMPQRFGLYEELSVQENLDLYADLHGVSLAERARRYPKLMEMTNLTAFQQRLAGRLSGGMKQKLGLACTLVRQPELLLLDEPTVGVDPLSRKELWKIIFQLIDEGLTVLLSTTYLDEAERCEKILLLNEGRVLASGRPQSVTQIAAGRCFLAQPKLGQKARELQAKLLGRQDLVDAVPQAGQVRVVFDESVKTASALPVLQPEAQSLAPISPRFEDGFMTMLRSVSKERHAISNLALDTGFGGNEVVTVEVSDLEKRFGNFCAVDRISFQVKKGEIFGLLGPNGAGKTTTFRMLCGLLPPSSGKLRVAGVDVRSAAASARARLGYVAQKYSLYGQLSVLENLEFFASAYGLRGAERRARVNWGVEQFDLKRFLQLPSEQLPGGFKQRLAMAAALLHGPDILFLDEPTSGADPFARRDFWRRITGLAKEGITVVITTHFIEEAEYCDHAVIMDAGKVLAQGTPAQIREHAGAAAGQPGSMEEAFLAIVEEARRDRAEE